MAFLNMSSDLGRKRLEKIHKRVDYLIHKFLYNEFKDSSPNPWQLCKWCKMKKDIAWNKPSSENKHYYLQCNKMEWICEAVAEYHKGTEILWDKQILMNRPNYLLHVQDIATKQQPRQVVLGLQKFNRELCAQQPHMRRTFQLVEDNMLERFHPCSLVAEQFPVPPFGMEMVDRYIPLLEDGREHVEPFFKKTEVLKRRV